jgi:hypothetical protein
MNNNINKESKNNYNIKRTTKNKLRAMITPTITTTKLSTTSIHSFSGRRSRLVHVPSQHGSNEK